MIGSSSAPPTLPSPTSSNNKPWSFKTPQIKVFYDRIIASKPACFNEGNEWWIWGDPNHVLRISESPHDYCVQEEIKFDHTQLCEALRTSSRSTTGIFLDENFHKDKVLALFGASDWNRFQTRTVVQLDLKLYRHLTEPRMFLSGPLIQREIQNIAQAELLGVPDWMITAMVHLGTSMGWPAPRLTRARPPQDNVVGISEFRRRVTMEASGGSEGVGVKVSQTFSSRRSKVPWNALVEYPYSFDMMLYHANALRLDPDVSMGYIMLLVASNRHRHSVGLFNERYHLSQHEQLHHPFQSWVLGCIAAGKIAERYAQTKVGKFWSGRTIATKIAETMHQVRVLNCQIFKHVMRRSSRPEKWDTLCSYDNSRLFDDLDEKWTRLLVNSDSTAMQDLTRYLNMFRGEGPFELKPSVIKAILENEILMKKVPPTSLWVREELAFGRGRLLDVQKTMRTHLKLVLRTSEILDQNENIVNLSKFCERVGASLHPDPDSLFSLFRSPTQRMNPLLLERLALT